MSENVGGRDPPDGYIPFSIYLCLLALAKRLYLVFINHKREASQASMSLSTKGPCRLGSTEGACPSSVTCRGGRHGYIEYCEDIVSTAGQIQAEG